MAVLYRANLTPTKLELVAGWLPSQPWARPGADAAALSQVGAYRFDDPAGEVGMETLLVRAGAAVLQVPLTYRGSPLPDADADLLGTMEHSVLGTRWVYDACADPVYVAALAGAVLGGAAQAELVVVEDGESRPLPPTATVHATAPVASVALPVSADGRPVPFSTAGTVSTVAIGPVELSVLRVLDLDVHGSDLSALVGTWTDQAAPVLLATARDAR